MVKSLSISIERLQSIFRFENLLDNHLTNAHIAAHHKPPGKVNLMTTAGI
jgi:hypothetical protein